jgi:hypothetical protein
MQKSTARKFHFAPPSRFTSFDHLVGADEGLCVRVVRVSRIDKTGPAHAQHFFHLLDRFVNHATRLASLKLVLQFNEGSIGTVEATRQNLRNVKERDRILPEQVGRFGNMELRGFQGTHVRCVWLI